MAIEPETNLYTYSWKSVFGAGSLGVFSDYSYPFTSLALLALGLLMIYYPLRQHWIQRRPGGAAYQAKKRQRFLSGSTMLCIIAAVLAFIEIQPIALNTLTKIIEVDRSELTAGAVLVSIISNIYSYKILDRLGSLSGKIILTALGLLSFLAL